MKWQAHDSRERSGEAKLASCGEMVPSCCSASPSCSLYLDSAGLHQSQGVRTARARECFCFRNKGLIMTFPLIPKHLLSFHNEPNTIYRIPNKMVLALRVSFENTVIIVF